MNPTHLHEPLRTGVAGAGVMGRNHARVLSEMRDIDLALIFDPDAVVAEGVAAAFGAQSVTTAADFVAAGLQAATMPSSASPCWRPASMCWSKNRSPPTSRAPRR